MADRFDPAVLEPTVDVLAELAGDGRALEFAIGTGRVALPARGTRASTSSGIELSPAMVEQLRAKPGGDALDVTIGDMTERRASTATFSLVYLVFNTINNLLTQDAQVACFRNAAAHLEPGGCFVVEVGVPDLQRLPPGERIRPFDVSPTHLGFDEYDLATQWIGVAPPLQARRRVAGVLDAVPLRVAVRARPHGPPRRVTLRDRWADWHRSPFTADSRQHVSVWENARHS